ncbi:MAG TPA: peptidylprolyl isomerase [Coleofasciculaceae cyanobacterium]
MSKIINISREDIIRQIQLSCQIPSIIGGIVNRNIIASTAEKLGITVEQEELQQAADNLRFTNNLQRADETWAWLQKHWLTVDDFEEIAHISVLSSKLAQHLFNEKVESFFIEHQIDYNRVVMYEVILDDEDLAMELFYAIAEGETSLQEVARQYIVDTELRRRGGYRGVLSRKDLKPEISAAVFAATPPQLLKPIMTSKGAHLIWVEEIIQPKLDATLHHKILSDLFSAWLKQQSEEAEIVVSSLEDAGTGKTQLIRGTSENLQF